ncbi:MAG TPA: PAS domain S-box protein [Candidatus Acidoferrales bacterium]|nr:PAS domain S-box protein [Candidatus Acidoferrales bacterium]
MLPRLFFPANLRSRLIVLILLIVAAAAALIVSSALGDRRLALAHARERMLQIARLATTEHEQLIEGARQLLVGLTQLPLIQRHEAQACAGLFRRLLPQLPSYVRLLAAKPNGDVFCSAPSADSLNIKESPSFRQTLESRSFTVGDYRTEINANPVVSFSYPAIDERGTVQAYVAISMDLSWFNKVFAQASLPPGATVCLFDRRGAILAHYPDKDLSWKGRFVEQNLLTQGLAGRAEAVTEIVGSDGVGRFHVVAPLYQLEEPDLFVSIGVLPETIFAEANQTLRRDLAGLGAIAFLALMGAWFGSELFYLRRVQTLLGVTRRLAAGDLSARSGLVAGRDEIHQLAQTIDGMAASLERVMAERKRAEDSLRESEQLYRAVVEHVADGIAINVGRTRVFVNGAFLKIHGLDDPAQVVGQPLDTFILPEDRALVIERTLARQRGEPVRQVYEYRIVRSDGSVRTVQTSATPITYRGQPAALVALRDRTEEKIAEEALRESENKFRSVVETAIDAVVSIDQRGAIVLFNASAERIFGYAAAEVIGRPVTVLMPERFRSDHAKAFIRCVSTGRSAMSGRIVEMVGRRKDGSEFPVEIALSSWRSQNELYFTAFLRDITRRKDSEAIIHRLNDDLRRRTEQLQAINQELEAFSYSVSHDLRAPLRAIHGFSKILLDDFAAVLPAEAQRLLGVVSANAQQMNKLIDDLLDFSRLIRQPFESTVLDMTSLARAALAELAKADPNLALAATVKPLEPARGHEGLIKQVFINLLANALKFTRGRAQPSVEIGCLTNGKENTYYVKDNGVGFDMAYAHKLFGVFQRLHSASEFEGTGVGLAIVKRIVSRHHGRVWAEAEVDRGATFYFSLPVASEEP